MDADYKRISRRHLVLILVFAFMSALFHWLYLEEKQRYKRVHQSSFLHTYIDIYEPGQEYLLRLVGTVPPSYRVSIRFPAIRALWKRYKKNWELHLPEDINFQLALSLKNANGETIGDTNVIEKTNRWVYACVAWFNRWEGRDPPYYLFIEVIDSQIPDKYSIAEVQVDSPRWQKGRRWPARHYWLKLAMIILALEALAVILWHFYTIPRLTRTVEHD